MFGFIRTSFAGNGWLIAIIAVIAHITGVTYDVVQLSQAFGIDPEVAEMTITISLYIFGQVMALIGQFIRRDLILGYWRKEPIE